MAAATPDQHTLLCDKIVALQTLLGGKNFYDNQVLYQNILHALRRAQTSSSLDLESWSTQCAQALSHDEAWAWELNHCRRTSFCLLYQVCNIAPPGKNEQEEAAQIQSTMDVFQKHRLDTILMLCLYMDRANCLVNMKVASTGAVGLGWYGKGDEAVYQNLKSPSLELNPSGATINKRLKRLQRSLYAENETINRWMKVAAPERLMA